MAERNLDFDAIIERKGTGSAKYDLAVERGMPADVLPMWVADMDFKTSSYIEDALAKRANHAIFGYSEAGASYFESVKGWMKKQHDWEVQKEWLVKTPGVVFALAMAVRAYTKEGDAVLIQQPVYYPFSGVVNSNKRKLVSSDLYLGEDNRYHIDFEDFEKKIVDEKIKMFILCSPHNPVSRIWTRQELETLGDICVKHNVLVVSDEIHHDFAFKGEHFVFSKLKKEYEDISVICTAPSKTFNIASLMLSNIFIPNSGLRDKFKEQVSAVGIVETGVFGMDACEAAYSKGEEWYQAMMSYVADNAAFVKRYVEENMKNVSLVEHEGTYLLWLDFRKTGMSAKEINEMIIHKAKLWLDDGEMFGECGAGFQRVNIACPRSIVKEALTRIARCLA